MSDHINKSAITATGRMGEVLREHEMALMKLVSFLNEKTSDERPLSSLAAEVIAINTANGWDVTKPEEWKLTYKVPALLALIHSEVSEALEDFRKDDRQHFEEEMADVVIRCLDLCGGLGIDLDAAVRAKLEKNRSRGFRHGGKRV